MTAEERREYQRKRYANLTEEQKDALFEYHRKWYASLPKEKKDAIRDRNASYRKLYYEKHKEEIKAKLKDYREEHKEERKVAQREYIRSQRDLIVEMYALLKELYDERGRVFHMSANLEYTPKLEAIIEKAKKGKRKRRMFD